MTPAPRITLVSTIQPDKKKACAEQMSNSRPSSATSAPGQGRITINALCKNTPSQLLRYLHPGGELADRSAREIRSCRSSGQKPLPAAFAGNLQQKCCSDRGIGLSIHVRQSPHETIKDSVIQIRRHNARSICGESNLLLVRVPQDHPLRSLRVAEVDGHTGAEALPHAGIRSEHIDDWSADRAGTSYPGCPCADPVGR